MSVAFYTFYTPVVANLNYDAETDGASDADVIPSDVSSTFTVDVDVLTYGYVNFGDDEDWFAFDAVAGQGYTIELNGDTLSDPSLRVYDQFGKEIHRNNDGGPGLDSKLNFVVDTDMTVFIGAGGWPTRTNTGRYELLISFAEYTAGTSGADSLVADDGENYIRGFAGNDTILGKNGADTISGGKGKDDLRGNNGNDVIDGDKNADTIASGEGNDTVYGGGGADYITMGTGNDVFYDHRENGINGHDTVYGDNGLDTFYGKAGRNEFRGGDREDYLYCGRFSAMPVMIRSKVGLATMS